MHRSKYGCPMLKSLQHFALGALLTASLAVPALAQNSFPTAGGATVPGFITMCVVANLAVPCNPGGTITPATTAFVCATAGSFAYSDGALLQCDANVTVSTPSSSLGNISIGGGGLTVPQMTFVPNSGIAANLGMANGGSALTFFLGATQHMALGSGISLVSGDGLKWTNNATNANTTLDTSIYRQAAGVVEIGKGAQDATGSILASAYGPGTIYSAAGTAVPACAAGTDGWTVIASDITTVTYRAPYVSGGTNKGRLLCINGTGWLSD